MPYLTSDPHAALPSQLINNLIVSLILSIICSCWSWFQLGPLYVSALEFVRPTIPPPEIPGSRLVPEYATKLSNTGPVSIAVNNLTITGVSTYRFWPIIWNACGMDLDPHHHSPFDCGIICPGIGGPKHHRFFQKKCFETHI